jgi:MoaA/NifB/PqqE/SkfB family radical SAM enzyme
VPRIRRLPVSKYLATARYAMADYAAKDFRYPFYCSFKVVQRCDSRCEFCNVWKLPAPDMPTAKVLEVIDNVADSSVVLLSLEGGEPLLRKDIGEILEHVRTKPVYLLFTSSGKLFDRRPMKEYSHYVDFLHVSIDEGHQNMDLYESLPEFVSWGPVVCTQIVVMKENLPDLEAKIAKCYAAGAKAVVMPACHLPGMPDFLPEIEAYRGEVMRLKRKYPRTIITTDKYLRTLDVPHSCNAASIIVDSDARLYYPCRTLMEKGIDLSEEPLMKFLDSNEANESRERMKGCDLNCHWYQYFATDSFVSLRSGLSSITPYLSNIV